MEVKELLNIEREYRTSRYHWSIFDYEGPNDDISFLQKGYFAKHYSSITDEEKQSLSNRGLTEFEILMLVCFEGNLSEAFQWESYENKPTPIPEICEGLDSLLNKTPVYNEGSVLYRYKRDGDILCFQEGDLFTTPHYLNTTTDFWGDNCDLYIITPLKSNTNARSLYQLRNKANENQVTFKRNTQFRITKVELYKQKYKRIYMTELCSESTPYVASPKTS